ncbi:MAG: hypothetical protein DIU68_006605 [Chloroflexota bacterium]|nr:MAG: hypothetical protein DIU68_00115 [Chloroflexota bacterium]
MLYTSRGYLSVEADVPCAPAIEVCLHVHDTSLDQLVGESRCFEASYLAWETVRKARNPFFAEGTGFEGYFIGVCSSPDEMLDRLIELGHALLQSNLRLYRHNPRFRTRLMHALMDEGPGYDTICVWSDVLGATLARLRCNLYIHEQAAIFQAETYRMTSHLQPVQYWEVDFNIRQAYKLPFFLADHVYRTSLDLHQLKPSDFDAGLVVDRIGRFGHPLVRQYLRLNGYHSSLAGFTY